MNVSAQALLALIQPGDRYSDEAYDSALLIAAFMRDVHLLRVA